MLGTRCLSRLMLMLVNHLPCQRLTLTPSLHQALSKDLLRQNSSELRDYTTQSILHQIHSQPAYLEEYWYCSLVPTLDQMA